VSRLPSRPRDQCQAIARSSSSLHDRQAVEFQECCCPTSRQNPLRSARYPTFGPVQARRTPRSTAHHSRFYHYQPPVLLTSTPTHQSNPIRHTLRLVDFCAQGEATNLSRMIAPLSRPPEKGRSFHLFLVVGEVYNPRKQVPAESPQWLVIPERGLFTGVAILGAIGSGKTSCCMYPFAEQILAYRSDDTEKRIGGRIGHENW
jgi:hypothetical protein